MWEELELHSRCHVETFMRCLQPSPKAAKQFFWDVGRVGVTAKQKSFFCLPSFFFFFSPQKPHNKTCWNLDENSAAALDNILSSLFLFFLPS